MVGLIKLKILWKYITFLPSIIDWRLKWTYSENIIKYIFYSQKQLYDPSKENWKYLILICEELLLDLCCILIAGYSANKLFLENHYFQRISWRFLKSFSNKQKGQKILSKVKRKCIICVLLLWINAIFKAFFGILLKMKALKWIKRHTLSFINW